MAQPVIRSETPKRIYGDLAHRMENGERQLKRMAVKVRKSPS